MAELFGRHYLKEGRRKAVLSSFSLEVVVGGRWRGEGKVLCPHLIRLFVSPQGVQNLFPHYYLQGTKERPKGNPIYENFHLKGTLLFSGTKWDCPD